MKKQFIITSLVLLLLSTQIIAQTNDAIPQPKPKRFSIGVQAMMMQTPNYGAGISDFSMGFNMRYFLGKRLAVTAQFNSTRSTISNFSNARVNRNGFEVPLLLEYHLQPGHKIRPFFSIGAGMTSQNTLIRFNDGQPNSFQYSQTTFLQAGYGMTFELGKKMLLTTQLFYRYNVTNRQQSIGVSVGLGWRRYKKQ